MNDVAAQSSLAAGSRARTIRLQVFAVTWFSYAGFYVTRKVFSVVKGPIEAALHIDDIGASHIFTTYLVTYMLGQFLSAWLSRRMTNRSQLLLGMSTSAACNLAMGALFPLGPAAFWPMVALMGVQGFAQATGWPCNVGLMANWTHRAERGRVMAVWATCYQLGAILAKAVAAFLFGWLGLAWSFWGTAAVLAVITLAFYFLARESPDSIGLPAITDEPAGETAAAKHRSDGTRQQMALIVSMGMIYFAFKFLRYALDSWSVLIMSERFHLATDRAGYLSTAFDWIGFLGVIAAGWASDKLFGGSRLRVIALMTWGCLGAAVLMWAVGLSSLWAFVGLLGLVGFMCMGPDSLLSGAAAMDTGSRRQAAMAAGIINGCGSAGPIVQEPLIGWMKTLYGADAVLLLLVGMTVLAAVAITLFSWRVRRLGIRL
jgi:sugar phosphate permease